MRPRTNRLRAGPGFTIIELMVTIAILAIMLAVGVPSFRAFINNQRVKAAATEMMTSVLISRSDAIKRNAAVTIAPTVAGDWTQGWSATATIGGVATTLHAQEAVQSIVMTTYTDSTCTTAGAVANMVFTNTGRPAAASCFKFAADSTTTARCVKVDLTGIPSSSSC